MTASQALSKLNHWLHPNDEEDLQPLPETPPDAPPSQGCTGYQIGSGAILHQQQTLVHQVNELLNLPDELQPFYDQTLDKLTLWLHLLPAHPLHHCEPGGAVRHALETSFWTAAAVEQIHVDHDLYPDQRRARQPVWRLMAGVAGLLYDSGRMVSCVSVEHEPSGQWSALRQGLGSWLQRHRIDSYSPHWQHCESRPENALSPRIHLDEPVAAGSANSDRIALRTTACSGQGRSLANVCQCVSWPEQCLCGEATGQCGRSRPSEKRQTAL